MSTKVGTKPKTPTSTADEPLSIIGKSMLKVDAMAKVSGETVFADDLTLPRMLYCKLKRSPHPHAGIRAIDTRRAEEHPGVVATLVGSELPVPFGILPISQDEHALALDKARFVGDPVAAVAAVDEETAERALALIDVDYEVLPSVMSIEEALDREDVRVHDYGPRGNIHKEVSLEFGDVEEGFQQADHIREDTFFFEGNTHLSDGATRLGGFLWCRRKVDAMVVHTNASLCAQGRVQGFRDASLPCSYHCHTQRGRIRRKERSLQPRDRRREALHEDPPPGKDHLEP